MSLTVEGAVTVRGVLDSLEDAHPVLRGTIREYETLRRRAFLRFFVCGEDISHVSEDVELPKALAEGKDVFLIVGAVAGGSPLE